jgi:GNAT superfamily N-acetyltransferase
VIDDLVVRAATAGDRRDILALLSRTLGWDDDARHEKLFAWKHDENVFGPSPAWVAWDGDRLAGFRAFLRWEFEADGTTVYAVRAVDTATDPEYRRRGVFRRLTLHALDELRGDRAAYVFNTPNAQSRPGYLQMGWQIAGRVPLAARPTSLPGIGRMVSARRPAALWSADDGGGEPAVAVLEDGAPISELFGSQPHVDAPITRRSVEYLRWRYGFPPLDYRSVVMHGDAARGVAFFRVRRRGAAREVALCDVLVPQGDRGLGRRLVHEVTRAADADYLVRVADNRDGCVPLPRQGPILTWRPLRSPSRQGHGVRNLTLGDVELF